MKSNTQTDPTPLALALEIGTALLGCVLLYVLCILVLA